MGQLGQRSVATAFTHRLWPLLSIPTQYITVLAAAFVRTRYFRESSHTVPTLTPLSTAVEPSQPSLTHATPRHTTTSHIVPAFWGIWSSHRDLVKIPVFWNVYPFRLVNMYRRFEGTSYFHIQAKVVWRLAIISQSRKSDIPKDTVLLQNVNMSHWLESFRCVLLLFTSKAVKESTL